MAWREIAGLGAAASKWHGIREKLACTANTVIPIPFALVSVLEPSRLPSP
jgi:hypothetical protein